MSDALHPAEREVAPREDFAQAVSDEAERARAFWRDALTKYAASILPPGGGEQP